MLRVFLDRPAAATDSPGSFASESSAVKTAASAHEGVTHEDCANFSREFGTILDVEDAVPGGSYTLEVSSPGLNRKLARASDFTHFAGRRARLVLREPVEERRVFEGRLAGFEAGRVRLDLGGGAMKEFELPNISKAQLMVEL